MNIVARLTSHALKTMRIPPHPPSLRSPRISRAQSVSGTVINFSHRFSSIWSKKKLFIGLITDRGIAHSLKVMKSTAFNNKHCTQCRFETTVHRETDRSVLYPGKSTNTGKDNFLSFSTVHGLKQTYSKVFITSHGTGVREGVHITLIIYILAYPYVFVFLSVAFSIYLIGGELGLGTGRFNTTLWRYCLFSKKWYIETVYVKLQSLSVDVYIFFRLLSAQIIVNRLPRPRRHMAVAFLKNKLYLFGGVGRHRLKLSSVDVYDIHAGIFIPIKSQRSFDHCITNR